MTTTKKKNNQKVIPPEKYPLQKNPKLTIKETNYGAGKGIYTTQSIPKGEELFIFSENIVPWKNVTHRAIQLGINRWLEPLKYSYGWFLNHSCNPTAAFKLPNKIVAHKDLKSNEEITIDYATVIHMKKFEFTCCCPNNNCRKIIRSFQYTTPEFQEQFKDFNSLEKTIKPTTKK